MLPITNERMIIFYTSHINDRKYAIHLLLPVYVSIYTCVIGKRTYEEVHCSRSNVSQQVRPYKPACDQS